jgi:hypothetical protein
MWISSFLNTVCRKDCSFCIMWSWYPYQRLFDVYDGFFLGCLFCSIGIFICLYARTLITTALYRVCASPLALWFFVKTVVAIWGSLRFKEL